MHDICLIAGFIGIPITGPPYLESAALFIAVAVTVSNINDFVRFGYSHVKLRAPYCSSLCVPSACQEMFATILHSNIITSLYGCAPTAISEGQVTPSPLQSQDSRRRGGADEAFGFL
jgi:hypothetical protein